MHLDEQAEAVLEAYRRAGLMLVTGESCTGGLIAGTLTEIAGERSSTIVFPLPMDLLEAMRSAKPEAQR